MAVRFFGVYRNISGRDELNARFKDTILLKEAVDEIIKWMPDLEQVLIDPDLKDPRPNTLILINGKEISILKGLETMLKEGDEVVFLPLLHAG